MGKLPKNIYNAKLNFFYYFFIKYLFFTMYFSNMNKLYGADYKYLKKVIIFVLGWLHKN